MRVDFVECIERSLYFYYLFFDKLVMPQGENITFFTLIISLLPCIKTYLLPFNIRLRTIKTF